jgi:hypothetical protein
VDDVGLIPGLHDRPISPLQKHLHTIVEIDRMIRVCKVSPKLDTFYGLCKKIKIVM